MAEDEETATARYIASNISTQLMLKTIIEIISTMSDDPDKYRARLKAKLFELADTMPLAAMTPTREDKVRAFVRETINTVLTNSRPQAAATSSLSAPRATILRASSGKVFGALLPHPTARASRRRILLAWSV